MKLILTVFALVLFILAAVFALWPGLGEPFPRVSIGLVAAGLACMVGANMVP